MLDFRQIALLCFGYSLLKHKMTICSENLGGRGPVGPLATPMTGGAIRSCCFPNICVGEALHWVCCMSRHAATTILKKRGYVLSYHFSFLLDWAGREIFWSLLRNNPLVSIRNGELVLTHIIILLVETCYLHFTPYCCFCFGAITWLHYTK